MTYADKLRQGQAKTTDDETSEHLMDASEVVDASGEVSVAPGLATVSQQSPSANLETPQHDPVLREPKPPDGGFSDSRKCGPVGPVLPSAEDSRDFDDVGPSKEAELLESSCDSASLPCSGVAREDSATSESFTKAEDGSSEPNGSPSASWADASPFSEEMMDAASGPLKRPASLYSEETCSGAEKRQAPDLAAVAGGDPGASRSNVRPTPRRQSQRSSKTRVTPSFGEGSE